jgi:hypothetical protein
VKTISVRVPTSWHELGVMLGASPVSPSAVLLQLQNVELSFRGSLQRLEQDLATLRRDLEHEGTQRIANDAGLHDRLNKEHIEFAKLRLQDDALVDDVAVLKHRAGHHQEQIEDVLARLKKRGI